MNTQTLARKEMTIKPKLLRDVPAGAVFQQIQNEVADEGYFMRVGLYDALNLETGHQVEIPAGTLCNIIPGAVLKIPQEELYATPQES